MFSESSSNGGIFRSQKNGTTGKSIFSDRNDHVSFANCDAIHSFVFRELTWDTMLLFYEYSKMEVSLRIALSVVKIEDNESRFHEAEWASKHSVGIHFNDFRWLSEILETPLQITPETSLAVLRSDQIELWIFPGTAWGILGCKSFSVPNFVPI